MRSSLLETKISIQHCLDLIIAFKRDATKSRYADWPSLMDYCRYSAAPVGRYLIDLHGGSETDYPPSDALCSALQVLNHLQDCKEDFETMNRVYLPLDSLQRHNVDESDLSRRAAEAAEAAASLAAAAERAAAICEELEGTAEALEGRLRVLAVEERALFEAAARAADAPLDEAPGAKAAAYVKKVVEVVEFEIPVGFVTSMDDVPS